ncbi:MAG: hypothetical protein QXP77_03475 [Candidatus Aenigmatarchaeota archaeon]
MKNKKDKSSTKKVNLFIQELIKGIEKDVISVTLFGDMKNFKIGVSDIDLFILTKSNKEKDVKRKIKHLFLLLDKKYKLQFAKVCFGYGKNIFARILIKFENLFFYRVPYYIFSNEKVIPEKQYIRCWKVKLLSIFGSLKIFWRYIKGGKIIHGNDFTSKIEVREISQFEKFKNLFFLFLLALVSIIVDFENGKHILQKVLKFNRHEFWKSTKLF